MEVIEMAKNIEPKLKKIGDYLKLEDNTVFTHNILFGIYCEKMLI